MPLGGRDGTFVQAGDTALRPYVVYQLCEYTPEGNNPLRNEDVICEGCIFVGFIFIFIFARLKEKKGKLQTFSLILFLQVPAVPAHPGHASLRVQEPSTG